jgi:hypothetical protein
MLFSLVLERDAMELNIWLEIEVSTMRQLTLDIEEACKGVINFFGDYEPKSIGDTDEDKVYWYMKVFPVEGSQYSRHGYTLVREIRSYDGKRSQNDSDSVSKLVLPQGDI